MREKEEARRRFQSDRNIARWGNAIGWLVNSRNRSQFKFESLVRSRNSYVELNDISYRSIVARSPEIRDIHIVYNIYNLPTRDSRRFDVRAKSRWPCRQWKSAIRAVSNAEYNETILSPAFVYVLAHVKDRGKNRWTLKLWKILLYLRFASQAAVPIDNI